MANITNDETLRSEARRRVDSLAPDTGGIISGDVQASPSLTEQTPGLDPARPLIDGALRAVAWMRERPDVSLPILGGIVAAGIGVAVWAAWPKPTPLTRLQRFGRSIDPRILRKRYF